MARYFLHSRDGIDEVLDQMGQEYSSIDALQEHVLLTARDIISGDGCRGIVDLRLRIDAVSETGEVAYSLPFKDAVNIIQEGQG